MSLFLVWSKKEEIDYLRPVWLTDICGEKINKIIMFEWKFECSSNTGFKFNFIVWTKKKKTLKSDLFDRIK